MASTDVTNLLTQAQDVVDSAIEALNATRETQTTLVQHMDYMDTKIGTHNTSTTAHSDIRAKLVVTEEIISTPITAGATVSVPTYTVGSHRLCVYIDGVKCLKGDVYNEVGVAGNTSDRITFLSDIAEDYEVSVSC